MPAPTGYAIKASNTTRTSTSALSDDPDLLFTPSANTKYLVRMGFKWYTNIAAALKFTLVAATGATNQGVLLWGVTSCEDLSNGIINGYSCVNRVGVSTANVLGGSNTSADRGIIGITGIFDFGASPPSNLALQWAQNSSNGTGTTIYAGSWMTWEIVT